MGATGFSGSTGPTGPLATAAVLGFTGIEATTPVAFIPPLVGSDTLLQTAGILVNGTQKVFITTAIQLTMNTSDAGLETSTYTVFRNPGNVTIANYMDTFLTAAAGTGFTRTITFPAVDTLSSFPPPPSATYTVRVTFSAVTNVTSYFASTNMYLSYAS